MNKKNKRKFFVVFFVILAAFIFRCRPIMEEQRPALRSKELIANVAFSATYLYNYYYDDNLYIKYAICKLDSISYNSLDGKGLDKVAGYISESDFKPYGSIILFNENTIALAVESLFNDSIADRKRPYYAIDTLKIGARFYTSLGDSLVHIE